MSRESFTLIVRLGGVCYHYDLLAFSLDYRYYGCYCTRDHVLPRNVPFPRNTIIVFPNNCRGQHRGEAFIVDANRIGGCASRTDKIETDYYTRPPAGCFAPGLFVLPPFNIAPLPPAFSHLTVRTPRWVILFTYTPMTPQGCSIKLFGWIGYACPHLFFQYSHATQQTTFNSPRPRPPDEKPTTGTTFLYSETPVLPHVRRKSYMVIFIPNLNFEDTFHHQQGQSRT